MTSSMDLMHKQKHPSLGSEKIKDDCWIFLLIVKSAVNNVCVCICVWGGMCAMTVTRTWGHLGTIMNSNQKLWM